MVRLSTAAAKQIPLLAIMARLGCQPLGCAAGGNYYFRSPFREEQTASFVVCEPKNVWSDFGEPPGPGQKVAGGDVLALVMKLTGVSLPVAKLTLAAWSADLPLPLALPPARPAGATVATGLRTFTDVRVEPLTWASLVQYLSSRGINWPLVQRSVRHQEHVQQIFYQVQGQQRSKPYFALAWKTAGGWEVRSKSFQGTIGGKGLTWLPGHEPGVMVFEGFMDYFSALTYYRKSHFRCTVLVLNSVSLLGEALPQLREAEMIYWFGDNDAAGIRALHLLRQAVPSQCIKAFNELYRGFKDFNDFLTQTRPGKPLPPWGAEPSRLSQKAEFWLWAVFKERAPGTKEVDNIRRKCSFYSYSNDQAGLDQLRLLRNQLGEQLEYYRLCQRLPGPGRPFRILEYAGRYSVNPIVTP
ncbi:toprim domain-containing protein [Hymenobacter sp. ASUV-10]|uniref:Toprim domain-containing protein n=1 Tax=Hymenobacter aranciens TaxID=3063996 RepID=A0ABT9BBA5_9BACT|nr:toprim domain-containing protein [Hymenobacter sp. ASUV-10]MDO7875523.1 toprim domain-containing protein [Hymenobacter sp. ASUV-10]